jgi:50S ribosomal protein L16 3-hydroxylase
MDAVAGELSWPADLSAARFMAEHWQQRPLFMAGALPGIAELLDPDELAGLACEPGIESRLIVCTTDSEGAETWTMEEGPFEEDRFASLPETGWTLLVQDVDKHLPELAALFDRFSFIPSWRIDDLMVSYAAPGGSVGPHVDGYDVFLIQGQGTRTWQIAERMPADSEPELIPDRPLQQLVSFDPSQTFEMHSGDALYLPPGVPHHGVSDQPCMTWSIGFRAPARGQLAVNLLRSRLEASDPEALYADPSAVPAEADAGLISPDAVARAARFMAPILDEPDAAELTMALGVTATTPKEWLQPVPPEEPLSDSELRATAEQDGLLRHGFALLARSETPSALFACGQVHDGADVSPQLLRDLCALREVPADRFHGLSDADWRLISRLYADGILLTAADLTDES